MTQVFSNINVKLEEISLDDVTKRGSTAGRNAQRNFTFSKLEIARMCTLPLTVQKPSERFRGPREKGGEGGGKEEGKG